MNDTSVSMLKDYEIKYYEQNVKGDLKESSLLNFLQDAATLSAESLGFGPTFVFSNNYAWVVLKYHIELTEPLRNFSHITLKTAPRGISKLYAFRDFEIYSPENKLVGRACSTWALIDMETRRMLPMQKTMPFLFPYEKKKDDLEYGKVEAFENPDMVKEFEVRFDDIDVNHHANNCNYMIWALEALSTDFRQQHSVKTIDIKYRKETGLNCKVLSEFKIENNISTHFIKDSKSKEELCSLRIEWAKENQQ